jgi:hypothetical protein
VFKNLFGKKKDGFYLQLEDEQATSQPAAKAKTPAPAPAKPEPVAAVKEATAVAPAATSAAPAAKVEKKSVKTEKKSAQKVETPKVEAAPAKLVPATPPVTNFAPDYLIKPSANSSRRLPGANMKGFLDLARQVQKPANIK